MSRVRVGFQLPFAISPRCCCAVDNLDNCAWPPCSQGSRWVPLQPRPHLVVRGSEHQPSTTQEILHPRKSRVLIASLPLPRLVSFARVLYISPCAGLSECLPSSPDEGTLPKLTQ